jgi:hypothetical protein
METTVKGPFPLATVTSCPACEDWIHAGEDVFVVELSLDHYVWDDYVHVGCLASWDHTQAQEEASDAYPTPTP